LVAEAFGQHKDTKAQRHEDVVGVRALIAEHPRFFGLPHATFSAAAGSIERQPIKSHYSG
jgi:hypothetical protein